MGYALPRLEALTGRRWLPLLLVAFWLAFQHSTLPLMFDARFILYRFLSMAPWRCIWGWSTNAPAGSSR